MELEEAEAFIAYFHGEIIHHTFYIPANIYLFTVSGIAEECDPRFDKAIFHTFEPDNREALLHFLKEGDAATDSELRILEPLILYSPGDLCYNRALSINSDNMLFGIYSTSDPFPSKNSGIQSHFYRELLYKKQIALSQILDLIAGIDAGSPKIVVLVSCGTYEGTNLGFVRRVNQQERDQRLKMLSRRDEGVSRRDEDVSKSASSLEPNMPNMIENKENLFIHQQEGLINKYMNENNAEQPAQKAPPRGIVSLMIRNNTGSYITLTDDNGRHLFNRHTAEQLIKERGIQKDSLLVIIPRRSNAAASSIPYRNWTGGTSKKTKRMKKMVSRRLTKKKQ